MPTPPSQPPSRGGCPRVGKRPLPDPASVRVFAVPDSAPPYDDALAGPATANQPGQAGQHGRPERADEAGPGLRGSEAARGAAARSSPAGPPGWPSHFAQVLAETLAGSRSPSQIVPWTTQRARANIRRLGPTLSAGQPTAGQRPLVRRVVTSRPTCDVLEMTVIVGFGPRIRALAIRLERSAPPGAVPGQAAGAARWMCTAVEAA
jgi:hypothetical protein